MKKLIILVLCLLLVLPSFMTGCSNEKNNAQSSSQSEAEKQETGKETAPEVKTELNFLTIQRVYIQDINTNEYTKWCEEQTNTHINWETIPEQGAAEKINLILASGDFPEVFYGCDIKPEQEVIYGSEEKVFIPLNDLIKNSAPTLNGILDELSGVRGLMVSPDGNIYSLPTLTDAYHVRYSQKMWINKTWLDNLGLQMPTTTDEFYQVLKAFKDRDPNGNGKKDEIPLAGAPKGWNNTIDNFIMNSFIYYNVNSDINTTLDGFIMNGKKVDTAMNKPEYREGLRYLNMLYKEGLIYDGSFVQDSTQLTKLVENEDAELVGAIPSGYAGMFSAVGGERYRQFAALSPLKGPAGFQATNAYPYGIYDGGEFVITKECKNPEAAMKWADFQYTSEASMRSKRGLPDVSWRKAKDGEVGIDGKPALWAQLKPWQESEPQNESYVGHHLYYESNDMRFGQAVDPNLDIYSNEGLEKYLTEITKNQYEPFGKLEMQLPPLRFLSSESAELAATREELNKYIKQCLIKFIVGEMDIEKDWDKYVENINKMGMDKVIAQNQKAYDRQYGNQ